LHYGIETQEELNRLEELEIKERNTIVPNGYNLKKGGDQTQHHPETVRKMKDKWNNDEYRNKTINSMREAANNQHTRERLRNNAIKNASNKTIIESKSKKLKQAFSSDEVRVKRSEQRKAEWENDEIRERRMNGIKKSATDPEYIEKLRKSTKKLWENPEYRKKCSEANRGKKRPQSAIDATREKISVKIFCVETGIVYKSVISASQETGIGRTCISCVLTGRQVTAGGYKWRYYNESETISDQNS
jgi:hypothetical protein